LGPILLVPDNSAAHPHIDTLKNIQLKFLSPSITSLVQTMDKGMIPNLKTLYSAKLINYILEEIQENLLTSSSTATISATIDLLQASRFIADNWQKVSIKTIQDCFARCGFKQSDLEMLNKDDTEN
jgi:phosphopantothenoylcysteine synthetase/decarboxylase